MSQSRTFPSAWRPQMPPLYEMADHRQLQQRPMSLARLEPAPMRPVLPSQMLAHQAMQPLQMHAMDGMRQGGTLTSTEKKKRAEARRLASKIRRKNRTSTQKRADAIKAKEKRDKRKAKEAKEAKEAAIQKKVSSPKKAKKTSVKKPPPIRIPSTGIPILRAEEPSSRTPSANRRRLIRIPSTPSSGARTVRLLPATPATARYSPTPRAKTVSKKDALLMAEMMIAKPTRPPSLKRQTAMVVRQPTPKVRSVRSPIVKTPTHGSPMAREIQRLSNQRRPSREAIAAAILASPELVRPASARRSLAAEVIDYKARHMQCEMDLSNAESEVVRLQDQHTADEEQLADFVVQQNRQNEKASKELAEIVKRANAAIKQLSA